MTDYTRYGGGFGIAPCGRTVCGGTYSAQNPRYLGSQPYDRQRNVSVDQVLRVFLYNYSSWTEVADLTVGISEDAGITFVPAFTGSAFVAPYDGEHSKIQRENGHTLAVYLHKTGEWTRGAKVVVQHTGPDEYGEDATRDVPVVQW